MPDKKVLLTDSKAIEEIISNFPTKPFLLADTFEARINNRNIVKLYDYFEDKNYLVSIVAMLPKTNEDKDSPEHLFLGDYEWFGSNNDYYFWFY